MIIAGREIGHGHPPYVVAEIGCNHGGSLPRALAMIDAAKECGADAVKWQCFTPDTITLDCDRPEFMINDGPWKGRRLYDLYRETATPLFWFPEIFEHARKKGITTFASVFDRSGVDFLERLGCPALKIASFEIVDIPLIRYAASTGKPLIISTGMASDEEISPAWREVRTAQKIHDGELANAILLHCVSGYPTPPSEANLAHLKWWLESGGSYGISDHTLGPEIPIAATALGACIIEKHFRLSGAPNTEDSPFSMGEGAFKKMVKAIRNTWDALQPSTTESEAASRPLRRSLFAVADISAGQPFTAANVRSIRPGNGLPPALIDQIIGRHAARDIACGEPLAWELVVR